MIICLACYEERLASVFENAQEYRFFDVHENGEIYPAGHLSLPLRDTADRTSAILACKVSFLICGAICGQTRKAMQHAGLSIASFIKGSVEEVLEALRQDALHTLAMPGCRGCCRDRCKGFSSAVV